MKTFEVIWTLYNPALKRAVDAPNTDPIEAESIEKAMAVLCNIDYPRLMGLQIISVNLRQLGVDIREHIK